MRPPAQCLIDQRSDSPWVKGYGAPHFGLAHPPPIDRRHHAFHSLVVAAILRQAPITVPFPDARLSLPVSTTYVRIPPRRVEYSCLDPFCGTTKLEEYPQDNVQGFSGSPRINRHGFLVDAHHPFALVSRRQPQFLRHSYHQAFKLTTVKSSSCIAHNNTILSECTTSASSQTSSLASLILPKIEHSSPHKQTYIHGSHHIHYIAEAPSDHPDHPSAGGLTFLVIADASLGRRIPFGFLVEIRRRFLEQFPADSTDYAELPNYGAASYNGQLKKFMVDYGTTSGGKDDAISNVQREIDDVRGIMTRNIEGLLERGERIDLLVDKTDRLGGSAREFRVRSRGLKRKMWWKNVKLMALLALVVILIVMAIVIAVKN
ncbi:Vesicle-associated membrane protein 714 [Colletotrichum sp. SAR11_59]|nr:Vesicle-associated membrane protein 714 [Colletotrichum sp. SAR11_59]